MLIKVKNLFLSGCWSKALVAFWLVGGLVGLNPRLNPVQAQGAGFSSEVVVLRGIVDDILNAQQLKKKAEEELLNQDVLENQEATKLRHDVNAMIREKANALEELRNGYYCSECKRPKSQIERETSETFAYHLRRVEGRSIPASAEMLEQAAEKYNERIAQLKKKLEDFENLENQFDRKREDLKKRLLDLDDRLQALRLRAVQVTEAWKKYWEEQYRHLQGRLANELAQELLAVKKAECQAVKLKLEYEQFKKEMAEKQQNLLAAAQQKYTERLMLAEQKKTAVEQNLQDLQNKRAQELPGLLAATQQVKSDLDALEKDFSRYRSGQTSADTITFNGRLRALKREYQVKENAYNTRQQAYDKVEIPRLTQEIADLNKIIYGLKADQPAAAQKIADEIRTAINARENIINQAITAAENQARNLNQVMQDNNAKRVQTVSKFYEQVTRDKGEVYRLCGLGNINNYASVEVFIPWTVVNNLANTMVQVAADAVKTGQVYSTQFPGTLDQAFNLSAFSQSVITNCAGNTLADDSALKQKVLDAKFDNLLNKF